MGMFHMYTGDDGHSHIDELTDIAHPFDAQHPAEFIRFNRREAGRFMDWHNAPRRQFAIILAGQVTFQVQDGTRRSLGPGDAVFVEDTTGSGHTATWSETESSVVALVPLA